MNDSEVEEGIAMLESIWYCLAIKIVDLAIRTYEVPEEQAMALKDIFLKQNEYFVQLRT